MFRVQAAIMALVAGVLSVTGVAPAGAAVGCHPPSYGVKRNIVSANSAPVVTHAFNKVLAPGSTWKRTETMEKVNYVEASVEAYAEASAGAGVILSKAEVKVGVNLKAAGSHTRRRSYSEEISIQNSTRRNREYVVYDGTMKHFGRYRERTCPYSTYQVRTTYGRWKSFTVRSSGTIRCDLRAPNAVAVRAKRLYCG